MGDFPVAAGCWTEWVVIRKSGDLGSRDGCSVEEEDGQGVLQAGEKEGRGSRAHGTWLLLPFGVENVWWGSRPAERITWVGAKQKLCFGAKAGAVECSLHATISAGQETRRYLQLRAMTMPRHAPFGGQQQRQA
ncbi:hypothetical protein OPT61_g1480 [Boeremia exigua]|uniref:Uncharacterized protein n=1 Tax=Boeremia exigua TaxID=749465 RepID=A0ACC2IPX4_9PLEO|nr:hypothetical protein OPT61_g1480 [Boeremia exigua]